MSDPLVGRPGVRRVGSVGKPTLTEGGSAPQNVSTDIPERGGAAGGVPSFGDDSIRPPVMGEEGPLRGVGEGIKVVHGGYHGGTTKTGGSAPKGA